jgi:hypothetical protein
VAGVSLVTGHFPPDKLVNKRRRLVNELKPPSTQLLLAAWRLEEESDRWKLLLVFPDYGLLDR